MCFDGRQTVKMISRHYLIEQSLFPFSTLPPFSGRKRISFSKYSVKCWTKAPNTHTFLTIKLKNRPTKQWLNLIFTVLPTDSITKLQTMTTKSVVYFFFGKEMHKIDRRCRHFDNKLYVLDYYILLFMIELCCWWEWYTNDTSSLL